MPVVTPVFRAVTRVLTRMTLRAKGMPAAAGVTGRTVMSRLRSRPCPLAVSAAAPGTPSNVFSQCARSLGWLPLTCRR
jgi:hypothetical protein